MESEQLHQCYVAGEFQTLSIDSTYRMMMALLGQTSYRASKAKKASQAIPAVDMVHALCTIRGKTGAVLRLCPLHSENSENIANMLSDVFSSIQLHQVLHVITDDPSKDK